MHENLRKLEPFDLLFVRRKRLKDKQMERTEERERERETNLFRTENKTTENSPISFLQQCGRLLYIMGTRMKVGGPSARSRG